MTDEREGRGRQLWRSVRKETPGAISDPDSQDDSEVAAMLRDLGIALIEVEQPTQLVAGRLIHIGAHYTREKVRVMTLPTALVVQVGSVGYEVEVSNRSTIQLDLAGRIDDIAELASVGAITPADAIAAVAAARSMTPRFGPLPTPSRTRSRQSASAWSSARRGRRYPATSSWGSSSGRSSCWADHFRRSARSCPRCRRR